MERITHIIDCEGYSGQHKTYLCEVSVYDIKNYMCVSYQIYMPQLYFNENSRTVRYQIEHVHGLPVVRERISDDFYTYGEVMAMLERQFLSFADLVAYKGGTIERDLLSSMGVKSINIEVLGCPKYTQLFTLSGIDHWCCRYHIYNSFHCSAHQVEVFKHFIMCIADEKSHFL